VIEKLYEGRNEEAVIISCEFYAMLDRLEINGEKRNKFWSFLKEAIKEIN
jgi:hypothetical protein